ncbi:hypothetical protein SEA_ZOOMAN_190 [Microbacterium phage Zooman]|nr:hypothetical protein SEA_ZOOMAN_190 [Microbacterium phage Zooman]
MPKPKQIFLLEVKYLDRRPYLAKGGGIFRTEKDMQKRVAAVRSRARERKVEVEMTAWVLDAQWRPLDVPLIGERY